MKLELKHLFAYAAYKLKVEIQSKLYTYPVIIGVTGDNVYLNYHGTYISTVIEKVKLILHPLSDLTKEIEVNGEKLVPIEILSAYSTEAELLHDIKYGFISVIFWDMLLSWHFDLYGLLDAGLAVDINTVK